ncbi:MAG: NADH-quinone oxidoreductase subunit NuoE [Clostridiales bacterium]
MCKNMVSETKFKELDAFINEIGSDEGNLITVLHKAQELFGYLPNDLQLHIARMLKIPAAKVNGVVTFYSYFTEKPKGKYVISVCLGTACFVKGAENILNEIEENLKVKVGQTTKDMKFSLDGLRCIGACGLAPVILINDKVYGRIKKGQIKEILESCS